MFTLWFPQDPSDPDTPASGPFRPADDEVEAQFTTALAQGAAAPVGPTIALVGVVDDAGALGRIDLTPAEIRSAAVWAEWTGPMHLQEVPLSALQVVE